MSQNYPTIKTRFSHLIGFFAVFNCLYNLTNAYTAKLTTHMPINNVASGFDSQIAFIPSMILEGAQNPVSGELKINHII